MITAFAPGCGRQGMIFDGSGRYKVETSPGPTYDLRLITYDL